MMYNTRAGRRDEWVRETSVQYIYMRVRNVIVGVQRAYYLYIS